MKTIFFISGYPPDQEGEANYTKELLSNNQSQKFRYRVLAHKNSSRNDEDVISVEEVTRKNSWFNFVRLARVVGIKRGTVVHYQGVHTSLYGGRFGEPMIILFLLFRLFGVVQIHTIHSTWTKRHLSEMISDRCCSYFLSKSLILAYEVYFRILGATANEIRVLCAGSNAPILTEFVDDYKLPKNKVVFEPHPCYNTTNNPTDTDFETKNEFLFLASGFVRPDKGYDLLIRAFMKTLNDRPFCRLVIVGKVEGPVNTAYAEVLKKMVVHAEIQDEVELIFRYITDDELLELNQRANVVVTPYQRAIGASGPIHRAMSFGKIVVASNIDHNEGLRDQVILFENNSEDSLANALDIASDDPGNILSRVSNYVANNSWDSMLQDYEKSYGKYC